MENAKWNYSLELDGADIPQPSNSGRVLTISGWALSRPSFTEEALKVTVKGRSPRVSRTSNKTLFKVCEIDSHNNVVSCVERTTVIVHTCCIDNRFALLEEDLQTYQSHIDEKSALGIDTAAAEAKYSEAFQKINTAKSLPSTHYIEAYNNLDTAKKAIADGEIALDRAWAENEVTNAQIPINNVDHVIAWIKGNSSTADDSQIPAIIAKRELAVSNLTAATDEINNGNYEQARVKAQEAFRLGNESYSDALAQTEIVTCCGPDPFIHPFFRAGIAVIILILIGLIWWKKFPEE
jgi:hypothetical protein